MASEKAGRDAMKEKNNRKEVRLKRGSEVLKGWFYMMPNNPLEVPTFFENVDRQFHMNDIADDLKLSLVIQYLSSKARLLMTKLPADQIDTYHKLKTSSLKQFRLTSTKFRKAFFEAKKSDDEAYVQFSTRLQVFFQYYLDSRKIGRNFQQLFDLMCRDRLVTLLPINLREYVQDKEGEEWFNPGKVASFADIHANEHEFNTKKPFKKFNKRNDRPSGGDRTKPFTPFNRRSRSLSPEQNTTQSGSRAQTSQFVGNGKSNRNQSRNRSDNNNGNRSTESETRKCFKCGCTGHFAKNCWAKDNLQAR